MHVRSRRARFGTRAVSERTYDGRVGVRRIVPNVQSPEPDASREFYERVLGLEVVMDMGWIVTFAAPENPRAQISVMRGDASAPVPPDASIEVDDVDAAYTAAERLGCETLHPLTDERGASAASSCASRTGRCSTS